MRFIKAAFLATTVLSTSATLAKADVKVVASIKPVHSLVAAVMQGVGSPDLIVDGAASPHTYSLKPSQARRLQDADLIFWIGHELEAFLEKPIDGIATGATAVSLLDSHGLTKVKFRDGGAFEDHGHDDHGHDEKHDDHGHDKKHDDHGHDEKHDDHGHDKKHDDHGHDKKHDDHGHDEKHDDHGHDEKHDDHGHDKKHDDHGHDEKHDDHGHDDHGHDGFDPHVWLDPVNAKAIVHEIEEALSEADPDNAAAYAANASSVMGRLDSLVTEINGELQPVKGRGYIVFHDAYQYFETRFGMTAIGSITVSPEVLPGAERVAILQEKVRHLDATCVFAEPQFEPKLVATVTENTDAGTGVLDPLGAAIDDGPDLYFTLIRNMARSLKNCLGKAG
jgi:zinc transport system substrate-binding protein